MTTRTNEMPRNRKTITLSLPPEMDQQLRQVVEEEGRTVSELLREAFRLYLEEREWRRQERMEMRRSRQTEQEDTRRSNR
ncbi:MAG: ribbon-helix-helix protein, CopG family [Chloroflexi bacterium]|nr:ribbon-helix-helix protein, CopG family [Chloroflexota bacterium]